MRNLFIALLLLASVIVYVTVDQYLFCPVYSFSGVAPFSGDSIYNPYAAPSSNRWVKCNFHAHAHCWQGLTYGYGTPTDIHSVYTKLHYAIDAVSNYQNIDTTGNTLPGYISCYEHGYNILKTHQLVAGAGEVCWKDYLLPQTTSNKQDILNRISGTDRNGFIAINHPMVRNGYSAYDLIHLSKYNCLEVLSPSCNSSALWDKTLSAGNPVFIIGNDDAHNVLDSNNAGKICTWVNVPAVTETNVIQAMKKGCSYAMTIGKPLMQEERHGICDSMPVLNQFLLNKNTLTATFSLVANTIKVVGENGLILDSAMQTNTISYTLKKGDSYARVVATYAHGTQVLLNPVFRYQSLPLHQSLATINTMQTFLLRTAGSLLLLFWFVFLAEFLFPKTAHNLHLQTIKKIRHEAFRASTVLKTCPVVWYRRYLLTIYKLLLCAALQDKYKPDTYNGNATGSTEMNPL